MADSVVHPKTRFAVLAQCAVALVLAAAGVALVSTYPGASPVILVWFYVSGCAALIVSLWLPSSFFVFLLSSFLFTGFIAKAIAHFVFGVQLIEPVGTFSTEWDRALAFAASGLSGVCVANLVAALYPSFGQTLRVSGTLRLANCVLAAFILVTIVSIAVYWANYSFHILRIGFPLGIDMDGRVYAVAAFLIAWGALLGGLTAVLWLVEIREWPYANLIYMATFLGLLASVSMGSRIQLLLYVLAAFAVIVLRRRQVGSWIAVVLAMGLAALIFVGSITVVSFERTFDFSLNMPAAPSAPKRQPPQASNAPAIPSALPNASGSTETSSGPSEIHEAQPAVKSPPPPSIVDKVETVTRDRSALQGLFRQLQDLVIMRWVGMEGVMTAAANSRQLGADLFLRVMSENPSAGSQAIYQKMSGGRYGDVRYYTFLTLPGPIGVASLSGSLPVVAAFMFMLTLAGHSTEWLAARATRNLATASVTAVSLAYLTVQMGFPWTLFIYAIELILSVLFLGSVWWVTKWFTSSNRIGAADAPTP